MEKMAAYGWGKDHSVEDWLFAEGAHFEFFQTIRLLEWLYGPERSLGESSDPNKEAVRIKSHVGLAFPASDVFEVRPPGTTGKPAEVVVNFLGLAGCLGPLPAADTELILERVWHKDTALRDFLDIFNHRLASLIYRARKTFHLGLATESPEQGNVARCLYSLVGLGTRELRGRLQMQDRALLYYTGLLAHECRSMTGLEGILSDYFQVEVRGHQFRGQWHELDPDQWTLIGRNGRNQVLGHATVVLGRRSWDQQARFELRLGPLSRKEFLGFLPVENGLVVLRELTRIYVGQALAFDFKLILKEDEVPETRLRARGGARLGWTSWLKSREWKGEASVTLSPEHLEVTRAALPKLARLSIEPRSAQSQVAAA